MAVPVIFLYSILIFYYILSLYYFGVHATKGNYNMRFFAIFFYLKQLN